MQRRLDAAGLIDACERVCGQNFPRFVQHMIWRYCSESGLNVCNGNRIDDTARCDNAYCQARRMCDRILLRLNTYQSSSIS